MEEGGTIAGGKSTDNQEDTVSILKGATDAPVRMPILYFRVGWVLGDVGVFVHGWNGISMVCGVIDRPQAIEWMSPSV
ncbi:MAG: hypothetical protein WC455_16450 [Dehalococcoidia bacterium]|jgi:hypothetical protein